MRGLGRSTWEVWGWLEKKIKTPKQKCQQEKPQGTPGHHPPELGPWEPLLFSPHPQPNNFRCEGRRLRGGEGCGRGRRVRAIRRCEPPAPQAGMSCRGSLYSPGMCLDRGQEDEGSGLPPCPRGRGFLSEARLEVPKEGGFSRRVSPSDDSNPAVPAPPARIRPAGCRSRPGDRDRGGQRGGPRTLPGLLLASAVPAPRGNRLISPFTLPRQ